MKPFTKKQKIGIGAAIGILLAAIGGGLAYSWKNKLLFWKESKEPFVPNPEAEKKEQEVAIATGRPKITWRDDSFPLSLGSRGTNVKALQEYIGLPKNQRTGNFGYITLDAWKKKTGKSEVNSISEIEKTITPAPSEPYPTNTKVYARDKKVFVYYNPDKQFLLGYVKPFDTVGYYAGKSTVNGWSKVTMSGYYNEAGNFIIKRDTYFVLTGSITDKKA